MKRLVAVLLTVLLPLALVAPAATAEDKPVVEETVDAINTTTVYWDRIMPGFNGRQFARPGLGAWGYGRNSLYDANRTTLFCGRTRLVANNAYACTGGNANWVAFEAHLMNRALRLGDTFVWVIVAHEYGHIVQGQIAPRFHWNAKELQADCFAGASMRQMISLGMLTLEPGDYREIDDSLASVAGLPWGRGGTHGSVEQRWSAFRRGWTGGGPVACLPDR